MSATPLLSLPLPLFLLVHLYILEYPHANNAEYDHDVFNARKRGLRERAQTMEDVAYFLVGKVEGKSVKTILPTYPCSQPSESLAFRTSLSKYLEGLRHQSIYPSSTHNKTPVKPNTSKRVSDTSAAWWWKDVVVRKSLLEECSGEKFERLMLSLSTHALMKISGPISPDKMSVLLRDQPVIYTSSLARCQAIRHSWIKAASSLLRSEHDLQSLKQSLGTVSSAKYASFSTERLQALVEAKFQSLLQSYWKDEAGKNALLLFIELAGIRLAASNSNSLLLLPQTAGADVSPANAIPSPLPVAAAHHPAHLKKLRRPVFQQAKAKSIPVNENASSTHAPASKSPAEIMLAPQIDSEKRVHQALVDALARTRRAGEDLKTKFDEWRQRRTPAAMTSPSLDVFWTPSSGFQIDFDPKPTRNLLLSQGLELKFDSLSEETAQSAEDEGEDDVLEKKIREIRAKLPPYPQLSDVRTRTEEPSEATAKLSANIKPKESQLPKPAVHVSHTTSSAFHEGLTRRPLSSTTNLQVPSPVPPATPRMSPSKSSEMRSIRRKSVRFSMAKRRSGRPSMFQAFNNELDDEVDRLIDETHDFPTDDEESDTELDTVTDASDSDASNSRHSNPLFSNSPLKTPRASKKLKPRTPINRIWTAGTPKSSFKFHQKMRQSSSSLGRLLDAETEMALPSSASVDQDVGDGGHGGWDDEDVEGVQDVDATPRPPRRSLPLSQTSDPGDEDEDGFEVDQPSMSLKEILLTADTSHFDLLDLNSEDVGIGKEILDEDASFVWE
ncbi:hypothetical protein CVT26_003147 [Gymnopilus dilepis]|uniref:Uncharacterized protein n=1 Tax=Gymnopilus dilepis TaxID=231916 RepID=A0A409W2Q6_9AGAR|nr:hypothetical protein CVT26_003147 [Gymnopilus dilepis]